MKNKKLLYGFLIAVTFIAIVGISLFMANKSVTTPTPIATPTPKGQTIQVIIESIAPSSGSLGTEVAIQGSGFTLDNNDIGFAHKDINFQGSNTAFINDVTSPDGKTLRFTLPYLLGACAISKVPPNAACPDIGLVLSKGDTQIFVVNKNGTSNRVAFTVE